MLIYYQSLVDEPEEQNKVEQLYYQYRKLMKFIALKILKQEDLAEDAVQDAFIRLIENLHRIEDVYSNDTKAFIYILIRNVAINRLKQERRRTVENIEDYVNQLFVQTDPMASVWANEWMQKIEMLPLIYRDVLQLKVYYELSNKEIAKVMNISCGLVAKRLERARKMLQESEDEIYV